MGGLFVMKFKKRGILRAWFWGIGYYGRLGKGGKVNLKGWFLKIVVINLK